MDGIIGLVPAFHQDYFKNTCSDIAKTKTLQFLKILYNFFPLYFYVEL